MSALRWWCAATLLLAAVPAHAQRDSAALTRGIVRGEVRDGAGRPVEGVEVYVVTAGRGGRSGVDGRFLIAPLPLGPTRIIARRPGWRLLDTVIALLPDAPTELQLVLQRLPTQLDTLRVLSDEDCPTRTLEGFYCRRRLSTGVFRDSAELASLRAIETADLLWGVPGIRRNAGSLESTTQWRCLATLVDGKRPLPGAWTMPEDIIALEYFAEYKTVPEWYRREAFAEQQSSQRAMAAPVVPGRAGGGYIPGRAAQPGRNCSLLVYWTRFAPRFDPRRDQSDKVKDARRIRALLDSAKR